MRNLILTLLLVILFGCSTFSVYDPVTGLPMVDNKGAPLLNRRDEFTIRREWLTEDNVLNSFSVSRNTDENADAQAETLKLLIQALQASYAAQIPVK